MTVIFDGKVFAKEREKELARKVKAFKTVPKLVSILVGNDTASHLYTSLKKRAAERVGIRFEVKKFKEDARVNDIVQLIKALNKDKSVHGIMIQLPLPSNQKLKAKDLIREIDKKKDVDGLKQDSPFLPAAVRAVDSILHEAAPRGQRVVVVGAKGFFGSKLVDRLKKDGWDVLEVDKEVKNLKLKTHDADVLVSAAGVPNLVRGDMVKDKAVVVDIGAPRGDVLFDEVVRKASFITPVPGGVGPVTVASLLENLVEAVVQSGCG